MYNKDKLFQVVLPDFHEGIWVFQLICTKKEQVNKFKEQIAYSNKSYFIIQNNSIDE